MIRCSRCHGTVLRDHEGLVCLSCGARPEDAAERVVAEEIARDERERLDASGRKRHEPHRRRPEAHRKKVRAWRIGWRRSMA